MSIFDTINNKIANNMAECKKNEQILRAQIDTSFLRIDETNS